MGATFRMLPAITDTRGLSHTTIMGMVAMDWLGRSQTDTSQEEDIVIDMVRRMCAQYVETVDLKLKAKVIYHPDYPDLKVVFAPAKHDGIDVRYYTSHYSYIIRNWSVDEYCENTDDWYDEDDCEVMQNGEGQIALHWLR